MSIQQLPLVALTAALMVCSPSAGKVESSAKAAQTTPEPRSARAVPGGTDKDSAETWLFGLLAYSVPGLDTAEPAVSESSPSQKATDAQKSFHARYAISGATAAARLQIEDTILTYRYFKAPETLHWHVQMSCYRETDLKTVTAILSRSELDELTAVVNESGFLNLPSWCGGKQGEGMAYPYVLSVGSREMEKQVVYVPHRGQPPSAFLAVARKLATLAQAKFGYRSAYRM